MPTRLNNLSLSTLKSPDPFSRAVGRPGGLVVTLKYYWRFSLSSIPTVERFDFLYDGVATAENA